MPCEHRLEHSSPAATPTRTNAAAEAASLAFDYYERVYPRPVHFALTLALDQARTSKIAVNHSSA